MNAINQILKAYLIRSLDLYFDKIRFQYKNLSLKRANNWLMTEVLNAFKTEKAWTYPTHLTIEPTNLCNLRCPVCHVVTDDGPRGSMSLDNYKILIDEVGDYLLLLQLWGWGEPFLHKDIFSMIKYAHKKDIKVISSTNGHFFENTTNVDELIDSGLDVLIFAIDGIDDKTYEKYRTRGDYQKVCDGLQLLIEQKAQRGSKTPFVNLRMVVNQENENQIPQMKQFAEEMGVDLFSLKTMNFLDNQSQGANLLPTHPDYRRFDYDENGFPIKIENTCKKPWNHPTIYFDGTVVACDYFNFREKNLGNAFRENLVSVWSGNQYKNLRNDLSRQNTANFRCGSCSLNYADISQCVSHTFSFL